MIEKNALSNCEMETGFSLAPWAQSQAILTLNRASQYGGGRPRTENAEIAMEIHLRWRQIILDRTNVLILIAQANRRQWLLQTENGCCPHILLLTHCNSNWLLSFIFYMLNENNCSSFSILVVVFLFSSHFSYFISLPGGTFINIFADWVLIASALEGCSPIFQFE